MARPRSQYVCQECGAVSSRDGQGKCEQCDAWNSLVEEAVRKSARQADLGKKSGGRAAGRGRRRRRSIWSS